MSSGFTKKIALSSQLKRIDASALAAWANSPLDDQIASVLGHFLATHPSQNTRNAYGRDILEFLDFCSASGFVVRSVGEISEKLILLWKDNLNKKHSKFDDSRRRVTSASVARKLCSLASMMDFSLKRKLIAENPFAYISRPKVRRQSHATILSEEEIQTLLMHSQTKVAQLRTQHDPSNTKMMRQLLKAETEWCILVLLFTVGMRVSELCALRLKDLSREGDLIRLHLLTKGGQQHNPLIHPETAAVLCNYIALVHTQPRPSAPVFCASRNSGKEHSQQGIHRSHVFRIVQSAARAAGINRSFSPHGCRATLATQLHMNQVPVVEIQALMNHAQVTTTQLYLHRVHELREAVALQLPWSSNTSSRPLGSKVE